MKTEPGRWDAAIAELAIELECETRGFVTLRLRERLIPLLDAADGIMEAAELEEGRARVRLDKERDKWLKI